MPRQVLCCLLGVALTAATLGAAGLTSTTEAAAAAAQAPAAEVSTQDALAAAQARLAAANDAIVRVAVRLQDGTARWHQRSEPDPRWLGEQHGGWNEL